MNFNQKIELFHVEIRRHELPPALLDPAPVRLLRSLGIPLKPPVFQPMWLNLLVVFISLDLPISSLIIVWPLLQAEVNLITLLIFAFISTTVSGILALILAMAWWHHRSLLGVTDWQRYGEER